jgi:type IV secretory pathway TrbF-like protein
MSDDITVLNASRRHFADVVGLGRGTNVTLRSIAVLAVCSTIASSWWAWHEARVSADRVERLVVYLDANNQVAGVSGVIRDWHPEAGAYIDFARHWVLYVRNRPLDEKTLTTQSREVRDTTDNRLYNLLRTDTLADEQIRKGIATDVEEISANLISLEGDIALLQIRWKEQVRSGGAKPTIFTGTLKVVHAPPQKTTEFGRNPRGLYATEFQITRES